MNTNEEICLCAVCRKMLFKGEQLADHKKYDFDGELDYIELAHKQCAIADDSSRPSPYWS